MIQQIPFRKHCYIKKAKALTEQLKIYVFCFKMQLARFFYIYFLHKTILQLTKCVSLHLLRLVLTVCGKSMYVIV